ncbi:MAG: sigma-54-dependent Fis family transcriptional regulator, partial [Bacteroidetes bacterium]
TLQTPGTPLASITSDAMEVLCRYAWPGNVRQLRNELERALTAVRSEPAPVIDCAALSPLLRESVDAPPPIASVRTDGNGLVPAPGESLDDVLARAEKAIIERVLTDLDGQVSASAQALGLTRQGLYKKMKRLGIDPAAYSSPAAPSPSLAAS